jgi:FkbM family methyltransferase
MAKLIDLYAKIVYSMFIHTVQVIYRKSDKKSFSETKHNRLLKFNKIATRTFNLMVSVVGNKTRYDYTLTVVYDDCRLLIRPFIFSELIMASDRWEPYIKNIFKEELKKNDVMVNVGANIGIYAIPLAKRIKKVIAFEPHPKTTEILERSIELNHIDNIELIKKAVGDSKKRVLYEMSSIPQESGITSKVESICTNSVIEIDCVDLDSTLHGESQIDWILIDAEGFELNVLIGARNILKNLSPKIIFEVHDEKTGKEIEALLTEVGYSATKIYNISYIAFKKENAM